MLGEFWTCRIDDHPAGVAAQSPFDDRHSSPAECGCVAKFLVNPEKEMVGLAEEFRDAVLVDEFFHAERQLFAVSHLARLIEHPDHEFLVVGSGTFNNIFFYFPCYFDLFFLG